MNSQKPNNKCCSKKKKKVLWSTTKAVQGHPTLTMSETPSWGSASHQRAPAFPQVASTSLWTTQTAEENGSAGKWSTSKPGKELNTALENTVQGGDRNSKHVVLTGLWKLGHHGFWEHLVCAKPCGFSSAGNPSGNCLLLSLGCRMLLLFVSPTRIIFTYCFPFWHKTTISSMPAKCFSNPKHAIRNFWRQVNYQVWKNTTFFLTVTRLPESR